MRTFFLILGSAVLAGCSVPTGADRVALGKNDLESAPLCCKSLASAGVTKLPREKTTIALDKTSPAFEFDGKKAFFRLYELPEFTQPYSVTVTSMPSGIVSDLAVLLPRLSFYDADFSPTRHFDDKTLRNRGNSVERTVFINSRNADEKYVAIYGSDISTAVEKTYSMMTVTPVAVGAVMINYHTGEDGRSTLRSSPVGILEIEVKGLSVSH